jgi:RluA family pseudouridine synthase
MNPEIKKSFRADKVVVEYPVVPADEGARLDAYMQQYMPTLSREFIKKKIERGEIVISGRTPPHRPSTKVHAGETVTTITYNSPILEDEHWRGKSIDMTEQPVIVYEDDKILAIHKPAFMTTHPAGRHLFYVATTFYASIYNQTIHSIHRIDRETSGLLLLGKEYEATKAISWLFENDQVRKCYFFIAHKRAGARPMPFTALEPMGEAADPIRSMQRCFPIGSGLGKEAETHFESLFETDDYVLALAFPKSGRQHQIRLHAAEHGYPLLGDKIYNGDPDIFVRFKDKELTDADHDLLQIPRHALHALALRLPYNGKDTLFRTQIAPDLVSWIEENLKFDKGQLENAVQVQLDLWALK